MANDFPTRIKFKAVDKLSSTIDRIGRKFPKAAEGIKRFNRRLKTANRETRTLSKRMGKLGRKMQSIGRAASLGFSLPVAAATVFAVKKFADFEDGLLGVAKVADFTEAQQAKFGERILELTRRLPIASDELLTFSANAAQLGIRGQANLAKFAEVMGKVVRTTNVAGEEGAIAIARIIGLADEAPSTVDRFASSLVELGNTFKLQEGELVEISTRVSQATARFGLSSAQVLGIGAAMKDSGIQAEAGGTVIQKAFLAIDQAVRKGDSNLSKLTGIAVKDLKKAFKEDAAGVFEKFVQGLQMIEDRQGDSTAALQLFGLTGVRSLSVLQTMAKKHTVLSKALGVSKKAYAENVALNKEFDRQAKSLSNSIRLMLNRLNGLFIMLGSKLAPAISFVAEKLGVFFDFLRRNPTLAIFIASIVGLVAILAPLATGLGVLIALFPAITAGFAAMSAASFPITGSVLAITAGVLALAAGVALLIDNWDTVVEAFEDGWKFLEEFIDSKVASILSSISPLFSAMKSAAKLGSFLGEGISDLFGPDSQGIDNTRQEVQQGATNTNNARVDVNFANTPRGTRIMSTADPETLGLDVGFSSLAF